mgnify:CR=1
MLAFLLQTQCDVLLLNTSQHAISFQFHNVPANIVMNNSFVSEFSLGSVKLDLSLDLTLKVRDSKTISTLFSLD